MPLRPRRLSLLSPSQLPQTRNRRRLLLQRGGGGVGGAPAAAVTAAVTATVTAGAGRVGGRAVLSTRHGGGRAWREECEGCGEARQIVEGRSAVGGSMGWRVRKVVLQRRGAALTTKKQSLPHNPAPLWNLSEGTGSQEVRLHTLLFTLPTLPCNTCQQRVAINGARRFGRSVKPALYCHLPHTTLSHHTSTLPHIRTTPASSAYATDGASRL